MHEGKKCVGTGTEFPWVDQYGTNYFPLPGYKCEKICTDIPECAGYNIDSDNNCEFWVHQSGLMMKVADTPENTCYEKRQGMFAFKKKKKNFLVKEKNYWKMFSPMNIFFQICLDLDYDSEDENRYENLHEFSQNVKGIV